MRKALQFQQSNENIRRIAKGEQPSWKDIPDYKGIQLTADVAQRMAEYRAYPSVQEQTRWIVGGI